MSSPSPVSAAPIAGVPASTRLTALDAFRGATMLLMVLVNDGGGPRSYGQLEHSRWNGWTLTDTVFPSFLWIVGVAITLSLGKRLQAGTAASSLVPQIVKRAAILYLLGFALYLAPDFDLSHARVLGVLQRIAICYLGASLLYLFTGVRTQIATIVGLLILYTSLMLWGPVPGYGHGNLTVEGNFAHYVDSVVLGAHNYASTKTWDPEGVVSTIPAIATALLGVMAGYILRFKSSLTKRIGWLLLIGAVLFCGGEIWSVWIPINKKLWSGSFTLLMAGLDFMVLAVSLWLVDERGYKKVVKPLLIVGMNSIAVYLASEILAELLNDIHVGSQGASLHTLIYSGFFAHLGSVENASLLWALSFTLLMYLLAYFLYKRSWFWRI
jgi:predicted acyltransferase